MAQLIGLAEIQGMIIELRGERVILDRDLAKLYQVSTKAINQAVRRNIERFPADFLFQLSKEEWEDLRSQIVTANLNVHKIRTTPYVFTRNGANMISAVLKSSIAMQRSIQIMRAFSALEEVMTKRKKKALAQSPDVISKLSTHSKAIMHLFRKDQIKTKEIGKIKKVINEMISLLQNMVAKSL
jgi:hypothetical protein